MPGGDTEPDRGEAKKPRDKPGETSGPSGQPKYLFSTADELNTICEETDLTIAQVVWENELAFRTSDEIKSSLMESESYDVSEACQEPTTDKLVWETMDSCIRNGVTSTDTHLPGGLNVKRRAPHLYRRLQKGFYPTIEVGAYGHTPGAGAGAGGGGEMMSSPTSLVSKNANGNGGGVKKRIGKRDHDLAVVPRRTTPVFPGIEYLSCMAIAVSRSEA
jgi:hypothetical protein